ncbi:MAG: AAA family ATPase [Dehalococcoidia bacterium]|nr:AAA family ATPase [Dehalococcoidia bacterium]
MGVSGVGKTTIAVGLAEQLGWPFIEGDDLHPAANVQKMAAGIPLTDDDRAPWLDALADRIEVWRAAGSDGVIACSALRRVYRDRLAGSHRDVRFLHLSASREVVLERMAGRRGHFMPPALLDSQYAALEPPDESERGRALTLDAGATPEELVARAVEWLDP